MKIYLLIEPISALENFPIYTVDSQLYFTTFLVEVSSHKILMH